MLFVRQQDPGRACGATDRKSHQYRVEENKKWTGGDHDRTEASMGVYQSVVAPASINLFVSSAVVEAEIAKQLRHSKNVSEYVSRGGTLARVMATGVGLEPNSSKRRARAKSAVPHAATKLNDTLARAWVDRQEAQQRSRSAASIHQVLVDAEKMDRTSTAAIEEANRTIEKITAQSSRRSKSALGTDEAKAVDTARGRGKQKRTGHSREASVAPSGELSLAANTRDGSRTNKALAFSASLKNKSKELDGRARVWDMLGGIHMVGSRRGTDH